MFKCNTFQNIENVFLKTFRRTIISDGNFAYDGKAQELNDNFKTN